MTDISDKAVQEAFYAIEGYCPCCDGALEIVTESVHDAIATLCARIEQDAKVVEAADAVLDALKYNADFDAYTDPFRTLLFLEDALAAREQVTP